MTHEEEAIRLFEEAQQLQLEALIQLETVAMFDAAGFDRGANLMDCFAALGGAEKVFATARERVLKRLSWNPERLSEDPTGR
jgi:hypothetical protein